MDSNTKEEHQYAIKDASRLSGLPESTLRYYESIGLIDPVGRNSSSNHRTYSEDDINVIVSIACLNATGMSIEDMRTYLSNRHQGLRSAKEQIALLEAQKFRLEVDEKYQKLRRRYIETKIAYWHAVVAKDTKKIETIRKTAEAIAKELRLPKKTYPIN